VSASDERVRWLVPAFAGAFLRRQRAAEEVRAYPIGFFHVDIPELQTAQGKLSLLFAAIDRTSKLAAAQLVHKANMQAAPAFLEALVAAALQGRDRSYRPWNPIRRPVGESRPNLHADNAGAMLIATPEPIPMKARRGKRGGDPRQQQQRIGRRDSAGIWPTTKIASIDNKAVLRRRRLVAIVKIGPPNSTPGVYPVTRSLWREY
jgi:hypothetical protein